MKELMNGIEDLELIKKRLIPQEAWELMFDEVIDCLNAGMIEVAVARRVMKKVMDAVVPVGRAIIREWDRDLVPELMIRKRALDVRGSRMTKVMAVLMVPEHERGNVGTRASQSLLLQRMLDNRNKRLVENLIAWWYEELHREMVSVDDIVKLMVVDLVEHVVDMMMALQHRDTIVRLYPQLVWTTRVRAEAITTPLADAIWENIEKRAEEMLKEKGMWGVSVEHEMD